MSSPADQRLSKIWMLLAMGDNAYLQDWKKFKDRVNEALPAEPGHMADNVTVSLRPPKYAIGTCFFNFEEDALAAYKLLTGEAGAPAIHVFQDEVDNLDFKLIGCNCYLVTEKPGHSSAVGFGTKMSKAEFYAGYVLPAQAQNPVLYAPGLAQAPLQRGVVVSNLPVLIDGDVFAQELKECGLKPVEHRRMRFLKDDDGKDRGFACITFKTPLDAERAIRVLDGKVFRGKTLKAYLSDYKETIGSVVAQGNAQRTAHFGLEEHVPYTQVFETGRASSASKSVDPHASFIVSSDMYAAGPASSASKSVDPHASFIVSSDMYTAGPASSTSESVDPHAPLIVSSDMYTAGATSSTSESDDPYAPLIVSSDMYTASKK